MALPDKLQRSRTTIGGNLQRHNYDPAGRRHLRSGGRGQRARPAGRPVDPDRHGRRYRAGVTITIADPARGVAPETMLDVVNELRAAGAEATRSTTAPNRSGSGSTPAVGRPGAL